VSIRISDVLLSRLRSISRREDQLDSTWLFHNSYMPTRRNRRSCPGGLKTFYKVNFLDSSFPVKVSNYPMLASNSNFNFVNPLESAPCDERLSSYFRICRHVEKRYHDFLIEVDCGMLRASGPPSAGPILNAVLPQLPGQTLLTQYTSRPFLHSPDLNLSDTPRRPHSIGPSVLFRIPGVLENDELKGRIQRRAIWELESVCRTAVVQRHQFALLQQLPSPS